MEPALLARYFGETVDLRLVADAPPGPDGSRRVRLEAREWRGNTAPGVTFGDFVLFGGFAASGSPATQNRSLAPVPGVNFAPTSSPTGMPSLLVRRGETVRATCWVLIGPPNPSPAPVVWNEDGTPQIPAWAVFSERVDLEWPPPGQ